MPAGLQDGCLLVSALREITQTTSQEPVALRSLRRDQAFGLGITPPAPTGNI